MWRSGVALILLIGLAALVANLWLDDSHGPVEHMHRNAFAEGDGHSEQPAFVPPPVQAPPLSASADASRWGDDQAGTLRPPARPAPPPDSSAPAPLVRDPNGTAVVVGTVDQLDLMRRPAAEDDLSAWREDRTWTASTEREATAEPGPAADGKIIPPGAPRPAPAPRPEFTAPVRRPAKPSKHLIASVQQRLMALGYDIGRIDGRKGSRTNAAVRDFQKTANIPADGRINEQLLARLDAAVRARAEPRQPEVEVAPALPAPPERKRGVFGTVLGGFQRLLGQDFDGIARPAELATYCRSNADTWIYDFGREAFVYCGNVNADNLSSHAPAKAAGETAAADR